ncbi:SusC/RagA family TonB-linked outer membrane protein [Rhodohalobacter sp. 614A]|uniref:SusC/RagA family TonB-linked outer membrane protein n=1 Tax=Rhodohalobacter sp. 614A TaxID=2908649 RepID=UPI001F3ACA3A|nr:TonB-dependent receptor [Rhodohalobacter sp. 614A]
MKKYGYIILFFVFLLTPPRELKATQGVNQLVTYDIPYKQYNDTIEKGTDLKQALTILEKRFNVLFLYRSQLLDKKKVAELEVLHPNRELSTILKNLLKDSGLTYKQIGYRTIGIAPKWSNENTFDAYEHTVAGRVFDAETGEALPGVNIVSQGSEEATGSIIGTTTDIDGEYSLSVPDDLNILAVSYVGYIRQEVEINGRSQIDIHLSPDVTTLDDIVVVGYGTMRREDITSSVSSVQDDDFNKGVSINPLDMIQGRVAGLTISRSGFDPNADVGIQLRGVSSIEAGRGPLIVLDGVPGASLENISNHEIESIEVLKDGSAAAIYGTRGTNGVIHITTKSGVSGETQFEYQTTLQTEMISNEVEVLTASQYRQLIAEGRLAENQDFGYETDWYDEIQQTPFTQEHNFAITGGGANTRYRGSINYTDAKPIMIETSRRSYGGRINIDHTGFNDLLNVQLNLQSTFIENEYGTNGVSEQAVIRNPTSPVYDPESPGQFYDPLGMHNQYNPVARLKQHEDGAERRLLLGSVRASLSVTQWLEASVLYAYENNMIKDFRYISREAFQSKNNDYDGLAYRQDRFWENNTLDFTLDSEFDFDRNRFNVLAGYSYQDFNYDQFSAENFDFITDATSWYDIGAGQFLTDGRANMDTYKDQSKLIGFFGRINYSFDNKYLLTASVRHEGSSKFGNQNKWGTFPALSVGWRLTNEPFMNNIDVLDHLMIRFGYGETGNQDFDPYQSLVTLGTFGNYYDYQTDSWYAGWGPAQNPNPNLRWETKKEFNLGIDYSFLEGKISGNIDLYNRTTEDLLFNYDAPQPPSVHSDIFTNVGSINNKGIEVLVEYRVMNNEDFQWISTVNWSYLHNEVSSLSNEFYQRGYIELADLPAPGSLGPAMRLEEGKRIGSFYGYKHAGFTEDGNWLFYKEDGSTATPDQMSLDDRRYIGNGLPKMNGGWSNRFAYKNWDLNIFFRGEFLYDVLNLTPMYYANPATLASYNQLQDVLDKYSHINAPTQYSDYYLERGDYIKLDNLTLGYSFDLREYNIRHMRVYATARNLLTFTKYSGLDPEVGSTGLEPGIDGRSFYPRTTTFSLGINIGF